MVVGVVRPAAYRPPVHRAQSRSPVLALCVPNMVSNRAMSMSVSSVVEHQTDTLAVAGSTPVPNSRLVTDTTEWSQDHSPKSRRRVNVCFDRPFRLVFQHERQHVPAPCRTQIPPQRSPGFWCVNATCRSVWGPVTDEGIWPQRPKTGRNRGSSVSPRFHA